MEMLPENIHTTVENDLSRFLPYISAYGVFYSQVLYWQIPHPIQNSTDAKLEGILFDQFYVNKLMHYLIDNGFAARRNDIETATDFIMVLTDRGRKLKELGSIEAYDLHYLEEAEENDHRKMRDRNLYWINFWIAVGAVGALILGFFPAYYNYLQIKEEFPEDHEFLKVLFVTGLIALMLTSALLIRIKNNRSNPKL